VAAKLCGQLTFSLDVANAVQSQTKKRASLNEGGRLAMRWGV